jgi:nitrogen-specific signal transduction histidine kinase
MESIRLDRSNPTEANPFEPEKDNESFISILEKMNLTLPESISGGNGTSMTEDKQTPFASLQNGEPDLTESIKKGNGFFESGREVTPLDSFPKKDEVKPTESKKEDLSNQQGPSFMNSFLIELVHNIKNTLTSIYHASVLTMEKYDNAEIRKRSHDQVNEEIKKIDLVLNSVLNFINIHTPIIKTNTLCTILEEILEANEKELRQKNIKIIKKYEEDLPDTFIHPEQVRFILHSVLQYAILSTPPDKSIGFLMKSSDSHNGTGAEKTAPENDRKYTEVMIGFNGDGKPVNKSENLSEAQGNRKAEMADLILKLAKEILQSNHGMMVQTHGERLKTLINLRFPVERRKVIYYEPITL